MYHPHRLNAPEKYLQTLKNVSQRVADNDALAYLYFANNGLNAMTRAEREAVHLCDVVFRITTEISGDTIDTRLEILKMRRQDFPAEQIKLNV